MVVGPDLKASYFGISEPLHIRDLKSYHLRPISEDQQPRMIMIWNWMLLDNHVFLSSSIYFTVLHAVVIEKYML